MLLMHAHCFALWLSAQDVGIRKQTREMEFVWRGASSLGTDADVFAVNLDGVFATQKHHVLCALSHPTFHKLVCHQMHAIRNEYHPCPCHAQRTMTVRFHRLLASARVLVVLGWPRPHHDGRP